MSQVWETKAKEIFECLQKRSPETFRKIENILSDLRDEDKARAANWQHEQVRRLAQSFR